MNELEFAEERQRQFKELLKSVQETSTQSEIDRMLDMISENGKRITELKNQSNEQR